MYILKNYKLLLPLLFSMFNNSVFALFPKPGTEKLLNVSEKNNGSGISLFMNVSCLQNGFWTVDGYGNIMEWRIDTASITFLDTLVTGCTIGSLSYCNCFNSPFTQTAFYGSDFSYGVFYYDGVFWHTLSNTTGLSMINTGGYGNFLYYINTSGNPSIYRFDGTNFTLIHQLSAGRSFAFGDMAVDSAGNIWTAVGPSIVQTDSIIVLDTAGHEISAYPFLLNTQNAYGTFLYKGNLYEGIGNLNTVHPNTLLKISFTGQTASIQSSFYFPDHGFLDFASCIPGSPLPLSTIENKSFGFLKIFPNPFNDELHFNFELPCKLNLRIIDILGNIQIEQMIDNNQSVQLSFLQSGIYYLSLDGQGKHFSQKIIKTGN